MVFLKAFILHLFTRLWKAGRSLFFLLLYSAPKTQLLGAFSLLIFSFLRQR